MRTVVGPTDEVVIVGAGLAGLSAALRLSGTGRRVTVVERDARPGGRAGQIVDAGYRFDTGPTVLTMPSLIADALACVGEDIDDWLGLVRLDPLYRARFADGTQLDLHRDPDVMADAIAQLSSPSQADAYRRYVEFVTRLYRAELRDFIDRNVDSPLDLVRPNLLRIALLGGFRRMAPKVARYFSDERLQRVFSFQAMYAGVSPFDALALYCVISYMDVVAGVFAVRGGMHAVPTALAGAAAKHGVRFRYDTTVQTVERQGRKATGVITTEGEHIPGDVVVVTADLPTAYRELLQHESSKVRRLRYSPSCFLLIAGSQTEYDTLAHHNVFFGESWRRTFHELIDERSLMSDPSFFVSVPTVSDPALAPKQRHSYYALFPAPNTQGPVDWNQQTQRYRDAVVATLEQRGLTDFGSGIEVEHIVTPQEWERRGMAAGTPFASAHTFWQSGPFRPGNLWGDNIVFAGSGTTPGVGVPMALLSGRLAAERVTGPDRTYRSRAWL